MTSIWRTSPSFHRGHAERWDDEDRNAGSVRSFSEVVPRTRRPEAISIVPAGFSDGFQLQGEYQW